MTKYFVLLITLVTIFVPPVLAKRISERGIYITGWVAKTPGRFNYLKERAREAGLNTLVIDAKQDLEKPFLKLVSERKLDGKMQVEPNPWLSALTKELHDEGFIVTVRIVVFKDDHLAIARPDLAVKVRGGGLYRDHKGGKWVDPYSDEVRLYNRLIAEAAAAAGVDEIQFDYIRFPAEGTALAAYYPHEKEGISKVDMVCDFLKSVREKVNISLAVDIFGVTAWQSQFDIQNLGQDLKRMAKYLDVISPMFYPSHFHAGYDGYQNPGSYPYHFVNSGIRRAREILSAEATVLVPWLQGFNLLSPNFGPGYINEQIKAAKDEGVERFLIWNARNDYSVSFRALRK